MRTNRIGLSNDPEVVPEQKRASRRRSRSHRKSVRVRSEDARASGGFHLVFPAAVALGAALILLQAHVFAQGGPTAATPSREQFGISDVFLVVVLVLVNGLFAMAEAALLSVRRSRIDQLVEEGNRSARQVAQLLSEPTRMLSTLQVGMTLVSLFSAGAAAERAVGPFTRFLATRFAATVPFIAQHASTIAFITIILGVGMLTLVIGEITPKSIAIRFNERIALFSSWPIRWMQVIAAPIIAIVTVLSNLLVRPFGGTATFHPSAMSEEELKLMVEESEEHGVIETEEKKMIHSIFEFGDTVVRKVMTPRPDITAIEADISVDDMIRKVNNSGHSRLPVYDDDLDNIVGIVHVKDVLAAITGDSPPMSIRQVMRQAYFIPENKPVDDLLAEMRRRRLQMAVVRNPDDGTVTGVVTIEDLLEEIVGEIEDEYDEQVEPEVTQIDDRTTIVDGRMSLEDFNERMGVEIPLDDSDTIGGFVFGLLGHQPEHGELAQWDGLDFRVEATDGKRIQKVCVVRQTALDDASSTPPGAHGAGWNGNGTVSIDETAPSRRSAAAD